MYFAKFLRSFLQNTSGRLILHSEDVSSIVTIKILIYLIKPFRTITFCICVCFLKENYGFHCSLLFRFCFHSLCYNYSLLKVLNHALQRYHIFTLFSHNRHDYSRIGILANTGFSLSIRSSSLKKIFCCFTSIILIFKGEVKNYTC